MNTYCQNIRVPRSSPMLCIPQPSFVERAQSGASIQIAIAFDFTKANLQPEQPGSLHYLLGQPGGGSHDVLANQVVSVFLILVFPKAYTQQHSFRFHNSLRGGFAEDLKID